MRWCGCLEQQCPVNLWVYVASYNYGSTMNNEWESLGRNIHEAILMKMG